MGVMGKKEMKGRKCLQVYFQIWVWPALVQLFLPSAVIAEGPLLDDWHDVWIFRFLVNMLGYATIIVPGYFLISYFKRSNYLDRGSGLCYPLIKTCVFGGEDKSVLLDDVSVSSRNEPDSGSSLKQALKLIFCAAGLQVAWCPTRTGLLATLTRDSNIIRLYDMQHTPTPIGDETEPTIIERSVQPCESQIGSFAWHPSSQNRMVVVSAANRVMTDFTVFERISLAWSSTASLMWACGRHLYNCVEDLAEGEDSAAEKDIATKMRERAQSRYGHDTVQVWRNHLLAGGNDPQLRSLWFDLSYILSV
ncbi:hypothetical protein AMECASPLE_032390 [Ameca splendens]|uniref:Uncharacterized protein n=1 Tax=Ameca splendens TaxID=208324 RepID=A0ABV0YI35_9TELE